MLRLSLSGLNKGVCSAPSSTTGIVIGGGPCCPVRSGEGRRHGHPLPSALFVCSTSISCRTLLLRRDNCHSRPRHCRGSGSPSVGWPTLCSIGAGRARSAADEERACMPQSCRRAAAELPPIQHNHALLSDWAGWMLSGWNPTWLPRHGIRGQEVTDSRVPVPRRLTGRKLPGSTHAQPAMAAERRPFGSKQPVPGHGRKPYGRCINRELLFDPETCGDRPEAMLCQSHLLLGSLSKF